ncbi:MAG: hypothetical protein K0R31_2154 [Clostridiales bacterium]|jgi:tripartite-type tricarboxylate transporter receptor subunit TctC|nr:hypothetical protein [Clostridiales bacterium]
MKCKFTYGSIVAVLALTLITSGCGKLADTKNNDNKQTTTAVPEKPKFTPTKSISVVIPSAPGGSTDMLARSIEKVWGKYCPQPMLVVSKGGGGGLEGATFVARSKPDGYTMELGYGSGHDIVMPNLQKMEYDPFKDLIPVSRFSIHSSAILVAQNSPFKSINDVINWAKTEKKPVTAAVSLTASPHDIVIRGVGKIAGIAMTPVPHAGGSQSMTTFLGGNTLLGTGVPCEVLTQLKTGKARPIAMATPERDPILKDVPTLIEQGVNMHAWGTVKGFALPSGTSKEIVDYYADLSKKICEDPEFKKIMDEIGQPIQYLGPEDFAKFIRQAHDDYGKLIKDLGITSEKK